MAHSMQAASLALAPQHDTETTAVHASFGGCCAPLSEDLEPRSFALVEELFAAVDDYARWPALLRQVQSLWGPAECTFPQPSGLQQHEPCSTEKLSSSGNNRQQSASMDPDDALRNFLRSCIEKAMGLSARLQSWQIQSAACLQALDRLGRGLIIADMNGTVTTNNGTAAAILNQGDGLALANGRLYASRSAESHILRELIRDAAVRNARGEICETVLPLARTSSRRMLMLCVASLPKRSLPNIHTSGFATVLVCDPERTVPVDGTVLSRLYGLTRAEAALSAKLLDGDTVEQAANSLFISIETARTHLKRILLKTGTNRQAELINLLLHSIV